MTDRPLLPAREPPRERRSVLRLWLPADTRSGLIRGKDGSYFYEVIRPPTFDHVLANGGDVVCRWCHGEELGRRSAGSLRLQKLPAGLLATVSLDPARHAGFIEVARRGGVREVSFTFRHVEGGERWSRDRDGFALCELFDVELEEIAPVPYGAYGSATRVELVDDGRLSPLAEMEIAFRRRKLERIARAHGLWNANPAMSAAPV